MSAILLSLLLQATPTEPEAAITGTVRLGHRAPEPRKIRTTRDPKIAQLRPGDLTSEELVVDADNHVRDVLVRVEGVMVKRSYSPQSSPALLEFKGFMMTPRVVVVRPGQELTIRNRDQLTHNAHVLPLENKETNVGYANAGAESKRTFEMPERQIKCKCDIHPWEKSWIHVIDHPFFAVTGPDGRFEIRGLPPGRYTVEISQEVCKPVALEIDVKVGEKKTLDVELETLAPPPPFPWKPLALAGGTALILGLIAAVLLARRR